MTVKTTIADRQRVRVLHARANVEGSRLYNCRRQGRPRECVEKTGTIVLSRFFSTKESENKNKNNIKKNLFPPLFIGGMGGKK